MVARRALGAALLALAFTACDGGGERGRAPDAARLPDAAPSTDTAPAPAPSTLAPIDVPEGCNPVAAEWDCFAPFPSDALTEAAASPSGRRVRVPDAARPTLNRGGPLTLDVLAEADGFSPISQIFALVPYVLAPGQLASLDADFTVSLRPESRTVLLDAETGERVLHVSEVDLRADNAARRALMIRPQVRLKDARRYVVAIRRLALAGGGEVSAPRPFVDVRDRTGGAPAALSAHLEAEVFPALEAAGVPRDDLLLAWDFTTRTRENLEGSMLAARALALDALAASPPVVEVTEVSDAPESGAFRQVDGFLTVPRVVENDEPGARLARDAEGRGPVLNGTARVPFVLVIPKSVAESGEPARFLQFGHGFFGNRKEAQLGFVPEFAEAHRMVVAAVDWWGMSSADTADVITQLADNTSLSMRFTDRVHQGMVNFISLAHAARSGLLDIEATRVDTRPTIDPAEVYFYGISQGSILGGTYLALSPHVSRGVLSVGGAGFTMLMQRARPFAPFLAVIASQAPDTLDQQKVIALTQLWLDRIDPMTWAPRLFEAPLEGSPAERRVLMQLGLGDAQVPTLGHHAMARTLDLPLLTPSPRAVPGLRTVTGPQDGSALVEFDFGIAAPLPGTLNDLPTDETVAHEGVRRSESGMRQIDSFLRPGGLIEHTCDGPCDPN